MADGRKLLHEVGEAFRFMAVKLHREGVAVPTIARSCEVGTKAVYKWLKRAESDGLESLRSTKAPGPAPILSERQFEKLKMAIRKPGSELGYSTDLWSGPLL